MIPPLLVEAIFNNARRLPNKIALEDERLSLTYDELQSGIRRLATTLADLGVERGDRVILAIGNRVEHLEALLGVAAIGAIAVPIDVLTKSELGRIRDSVDPVGIIAEERFLNALNEQEKSQLASLHCIVICDRAGGWILSRSPEVQAAELPLLQADDAFLFMLTSGTTGTPKSCIVSHGAYAMRCIQKCVEGSVRSEDVHLAVLPICFNAGRGAVLAHLYFGATTVLMKEFEASSVASVTRAKGITTMTVVPRVCAKLAEHKADAADYATLRHISCTGAALPLAVKTRFIATVTPRLFASYGTTDTGPITVLPPQELISKHGSAGRPTWGVDVKILDEDGNIVEAGAEGEVACRSPYLTEGYFGIEQSPLLAGGWFLTGDIGVIETDGLLYLRSRRKEIIKSGGTSIYPAEVEEAVRLHEAVKEVSVFGVPSEEWGEMVVAAVVREMGSEISEIALREFCKARLASYKAPRDILFLDSMPHNAMGKVDKRQLVDAYKLKRDLDPGVATTG